MPGNTKTSSECGDFNSGAQIITIEEIGCKSTNKSIASAGAVHRNKISRCRKTLFHRSSFQEATELSKCNDNSANTFLKHDICLMLPTYKENPLPFEWDVVRMPMDKNQNTKAGILNWGISKSTKNPEAAWDLLKFLCGPEGNRIVAESNMALPGSTDKEALQIVLDSKFPSNVKAFVDSVPDCDLKDQLSIYRTEVNTKVQQLVDEMLIGKSTPEETQEKLIKEINAILAN